MQKLIAEVSNQKKTETLVISADASNCYDIVAHPFVSLTAQHFGLQLQYLLLLLKTTKSMNMFLQTEHGTSSLCLPKSLTNTIPRSNERKWCSTSPLDDDIYYADKIYLPKNFISTLVLTNVTKDVLIDSTHVCRWHRSERVEHRKKVDVRSNWGRTKNDRRMTIHSIGFRRIHKVRETPMGITRLLLNWRKMPSNSSYSIPTQCHVKWYLTYFRVHATKWN